MPNTEDDDMGTIEATIAEVSTNLDQYLRETYAETEKTKDA